MVRLIFDIYPGETKIEQRGLKWDQERRDIGLVSRGWGKKLKSGEGGSMNLLKFQFLHV